MNIYFCIESCLLSFSEETFQTYTFMQEVDTKREQNQNYFHTQQRELWQMNDYRRGSE